jgi:hypothetical protein
MFEQVIIVTSEENTEIVWDSVENLGGRIVSSSRTNLFETVRTFIVEILDDAIENLRWDISDFATLQVP